VRVGIYARVSTDAQEARGTIGSQLEALRARVVSDGDELAGEYIDDGISGARLDRPASTPCATPPRPVSSRRCGVSPPTGCPGPTPTRCSSPTSSPATA
jgi:Site-specific recombinases, DNA invertase Pin homologs